MSDKFKQFMYYTSSDFCKAKCFDPCHRPQGSWALETRMLARACKIPRSLVDEAEGEIWAGLFKARLS